MRPTEAARAVLRTPLGASACAMLIVLTATAVFAPMFLTDAANMADTSNLNQPPSSEHWLGTDSLGRDIAARVLVATRLSLVLALSATLIGVAGGVTLGALPTVANRRLAQLVNACIRISIAFPALLIALTLAVVFGVGARGATLAIGIASIPGFARLTQTLAAGIAHSDYLAAARLSGVGPVRLLRRHILPNVAEPLVINATISAGASLLAFASLSFLGLGVQPPDYDWGRLLLEGLNRVYLAPIAALGPGAAVVFAGLTFSLLGEAAAVALGHRSHSPKLRRRSRSAPAQPTGESRPPARRGAQESDPLLTVENLSVSFPTASGLVSPVVDVSFDVEAAQIVGIVGESGSGKSLTALSVAGLLPAGAAVAAERMVFAGTALTDVEDHAVRTVRAASLAVVFQDPMSSLNPAMKVGRQVGEIAEVHMGASRAHADDLAIAALQEVHITQPQRRARQYPHEYSGGMRQRAMLAMGVIGRPKLIIADEPTTALDVTVQRKVLRLIKQLRDTHGIAVLLISHDMAVIAELCERVLVMYAGRVVEEGPIEQVLNNPAHPYTRALVGAIPDMSTDTDEPLATIAGRPPDPAARPTGCAYNPRCAQAQPRCREEAPELLHLDSRKVACWFPVASSPVTDSSAATSEVAS